MLETCASVTFTDFQRQTEWYLPESLCAGNMGTVLPWLPYVYQNFGTLLPQHFNVILSA